MTEARTPDNRLSWRPRFQLGSLLLVMVVFCVMAAAARFLVRAAPGATSPKALFLIFAVAAPMLIPVALSLVRVAVHWLARFPRR